MPRKRNCPDCGKVCHGVRCRQCSRPYITKWKAKGDAQRNHSLFRKYGLSLEDFMVWWIAQSGRCGICTNPMSWPLKKKGQPLTTVSVDHDHATGEVRGLLCSGCNKGLGMFKDNVEFLRKAIKWLT